MKSLALEAEVLKSRSNRAVGSVHRWLTPKRLSQMLAVGSWLMLLLPLPLMWLLTLSFDEAWIIAGAANIGIEGKFTIGSTIGSTSTGGIYVLVQALLAAVLGKKLWLARLFVYATLLLLARELWILTRSFVPGRYAQWIALSLMLGVPGLLFYSSVAYGMTPALWLLFWVVRRWCFCSESQRTIRRAVEVGVLSGLCVATRLNFALLLPAILVAALTAAEHRRRRMGHAALAVLVGALVVLGNLFILAYLSRYTISENADAASYAVGLRGVLSGLHPNLLTMKVMALQEGLPIGMVLVAAIFLLPRLLTRKDPAHTAEASKVLLLFSLPLLVLWLGSPKYLYRYLLPGLVVIAVTLALLGLAGLRQLKLRHRLGILALVSIWSLGQLGAELVRLVRIALHGDTDNVIAWFSKERAPAGLYSLAAKRAELAVAAFLSGLPHNTEIACIGPDALDMIYFTGRDVRDIGAYEPTGARIAPSYLLYRPNVLGSELKVSLEAQSWLRSNCVIERQFGRVVVYRITGSLPEDRSILQWRRML